MPSRIDAAGEVITPGPRPQYADLIRIDRGRRVAASNNTVILKPFDRRARTSDVTDRLLTAAIEVPSSVEGRRGVDRPSCRADDRRDLQPLEGKQDFLDALDVVLMQIAQLLAVGPDAGAADVLGSLGADLMDRRPPATRSARAWSWPDVTRPSARPPRQWPKRNPPRHLIDNGRTWHYRSDASTRTSSSPCAAISLGFVVMGAIEKPTADADEWDTVIHRLVGDLPAALHRPDPDHEDL